MYIYRLITSLLAFLSAALTLTHSTTRTLRTHITHAYYAHTIRTALFLKSYFSVNGISLRTKHTTFKKLANDFRTNMERVRAGEESPERKTNGKEEEESAPGNR